MSASAVDAKTGQKSNNLQRNGFYKPELDILRFSAFLLIYLHHVIPENLREQHGWLDTLQVSGGVGLPLFFLLSAYLITELLIREEERTATIHLKAFFLRRILRIWPLYFLTIGTCALVNLYLPTMDFPGKALLAFSALAGNWYVYVHGFSYSLANPLWSISVEEQFYLVWPFSFRSTGKRGLAILSAGVFAAAYICLYWMGGHAHPRYQVWTNSLIQFQFFSVGAALALLLHGRSPRISWPSRVTLLVSAAILVALGAKYFGVIENHPSPASALLPGYLALVFGTTLLFLAVYEMPVSDRLKLLVLLGRVSYGLYVFHLASFRIATLLCRKMSLAVSPHPTAGAAIANMGLGLVICVGLATVSYNLLELPFLRLKRRFTFVQTRDA